MLKFPEHPERWWQKRLVDNDGHPIPAELAVLRHILREGESGDWLNSRGTRTGVTSYISKNGRRKNPAHN